MADYEVLGPGGHARLVSDIKAYVNRADGVGTTQLADESVTMDKLGDDVTDELDGIVHDGDPLNGNVLKGTLAEGTVLTADDAWAAPPESVEVFGVSTQAGTPTPDAPVEIKSVDDLTLVFAGKNLIANTKQSDTKLGISFTVNADKSITVSGTSTGQPTFALDTIKIPAGSYYLSGCPSGLNNNAFIYFPGTSITGDYGNGRAFTIAEPMTITPTILVRTGTTLNATFKPQLEAGTTATTYAPYVGQSVEIPLSDHIARSLPDGTRDELTLTYQGPSTEHEGWGVFGKTLTQNLGDWTILGTETVYNAVDLGNCWRFNIARSGFAARRADAAVLCTKLPAATGWATDTPHIFSNNTSLWAYVESETLENAVASLANAEVIYPLLNPITTDLGTVELPILPNPLTAWADGGSAQPTMALSYERDVTIVIEQLEAQIEELLTS